MDYKTTNWWNYIDEPIQDLAQQSFEILKAIEAADQKEWLQQHDYSFVVFSLAKAYEGFLKKLFFDMGLISKRQHDGDRFRIGRSLNPFLPKRYQWDWVYPKLVTYCQGEQVPQQMWEVWKTARNKIFHYFPGSHESVTIDHAKELVTRISEAMDAALNCKH